jgi:hypothetical protein
MMLTQREIDGMSCIGPSEERLWEDARRVALLFGACASGDSRELFWNHLFLATGNFKRQAVLFPPTLQLTESEYPREVPRQIGVRCGNNELISLNCEDPESWKQFEEHTRGIGVATCTALLGFLWPDRHAIVDVRALNVAVGLAGIRIGWDASLAQPTDTKNIDTTWSSYGWYRDQVLQVAQDCDRDPLSIERTLNRSYEFGLVRVGRRVQTQTWDSFGRKLDEYLSKE